MNSKLTRWGVAAAAVAALVLVPVLVLARPYLGAMFGFRCDSGNTSLTDLRSVDDLRARFDANAGKPRLVLLVSPT